MRGNIRSDFKHVADDLGRLGHRYLESGRKWLDDWRMQMNRNREHVNQPPRERGYASDRERERAQAGVYGGGPRAAGWVYGRRHEEEAARDAGARERAGNAYHAYEAGYDEPPYGYARSGYESGYGGPGGYAARAGYEAGYGGESSRSGYGGSDYQPGDRYAGQYGNAAERSSWNDRPRPGGYRGLGPKNYARSDERIREDLCERLAEADDIDASDIDVSVREGMVSLQGEVDDRWMKYRAEDLADNCAGVKDVQNNLHVMPQSVARSRYSPTGRAQQRAQQEYERGIEERTSSAASSAQAEDAARH